MGDGQKPNGKFGLVAQFKTKRKRALFHARLPARARGREIAGDAT